MNVRWLVIGVDDYHNLHTINNVHCAVNLANSVDDYYNLHIINTHHPSPTTHQYYEYETES